MAKLLSGKYRCLDTTGCGSRDALRKYDDGTAFCFSCQEFFSKKEVDGGDMAEATSDDDDFTPTSTETVAKPSAPTPKSKMKIPSPSEIKDFRSRGFQDRLIKKDVAEFYGVKVTYNAEGAINAHYYPYEGGKEYKIRRLPKEFIWTGKSTGLFGRELFSGGGKRLVICEGEIDTLSVAQASYDRYKKFYPVVGVSSSVMSKSILEEREWVRSFKEVVLCFDNDDAGKKIEAEAIKIVGADRVKLVRLGQFNDANEVLKSEGGSDALMQLIFDAETYRPEGIIGKEALWDALVNYNNVESHPYSPALEGVNSKLKGKRPGEIVLLISGTGSGKSTILREEMLNILQTTDSKIGVVSLEEAPAETARKLAGMAINRNPAKEEIPIEDLKVGFDKVFGDDRVILLDHQGSINDNSIIDQLEYMCLSGCRYLFVDHITILVSEGVENLTGNEAQDKVMNDLLRLVKRYPVWIGLVSHLRKAPGGGKSFEEGKLPSIDDIRGSGSIKQISFDIISFARNLTATLEDERNTILMRILKSRYTGLTGNVPGAKYNYDTGRLTAATAMGDDFTAI